MPSKRRNVITKKVGKEISENPELHHTQSPNTKKSVQFANVDENKDNDETLSTTKERLHRLLKNIDQEPYAPSFTIAFRILLFVRIFSAIFSTIQDCDEVFNYWEPTHYLTHGKGLQTWEYSPVYAIRSWSYVGLHALLIKLAEFLRVLVGGGTDDKIRLFYSLRMIFGIISAFTEAKLYRALVDKVEPRIGRYYLFMSAFSAGIWNAAVAYLPSSFAMYTTTLAFSYAIEQPSVRWRRVLSVVFYFILGASLGWPFSAALALPFALEELFVQGQDVGGNSNQFLRRLGRLFIASIVALLIIVGPIIFIDYIAYRKIFFASLNIILYNVFGGKELGPNLYGTEPWYFYVTNGVINFNAIFLLALISLPIMLTSFLTSRRKMIKFYRLSSSTESSAVALVIRLVPFYIWFFIFSIQPHKEERFMYVAYPLICLNAAVALFFVRQFFEFVLSAIVVQDFRVKSTQRGIGRLCSLFTAGVLISSAAISTSRAVALYKHYYAPIQVYTFFSTREWPRYVNEVTRTASTSLDGILEPHDITGTLCVGKEWYRFPSHYFLPQGVRFGFVQSEFNGILPKYFNESDNNQLVNGENALTSLWKYKATWTLPTGMNERNQQEFDRYIHINECDYLIDLDLPSKRPTSLEPRYSDSWNKVYCQNFLDAAITSTLARVFYLPGERVWGEYCLLSKPR